MISKHLVKYKLQAMTSTLKIPSERIRYMLYISDQNTMIFIKLPKNNGVRIGQC